MIESNDKKELNEAVLKQLKFKIYNWEHENYKTKKFTDSEMVSKIRKEIAEKVRTEENL